jgi:hypothetical protein
MTDPPARMTKMEVELAGLDRRMTDAFIARDKAVDVALTSLSQHLTVMNEFRGAMQDQAAKFITRSEHNAVIETVNHVQLQARSVAAEYVPRVDMNIMARRIENLENLQHEQQGRYAMIAVLFSAGVVLINLCLAFWPRLIH